MRNRFYRLLPWLVLMFSLAVTLWIWRDACRENKRVGQEHFDRTFGRVTLVVRDRIDFYSNANNGGAALLRHSVVVTRVEWRQFVDSLDLEQRHRGVTGVGYIAAVEAAELSAFETQARIDGYSDFKVRSSGRHGRLYPVKLIEPLERNLNVLGLDMRDEAAPTDAMERARKTGRAQISKRMILKDPRSSTGFTLYLPLYGSEMPPDEAAERRRKHTGWIYAPVVAQDFIEGLLDELLPGARTEISLAIYSSDAISESELLYRDPSPPAEDLDLRDAHTSVEVIEMLGQPWTFVAQPGADFASFVPPRNAPRVLVSGLLISGTVFALFLSMSRTRSRALTLAHSMTHDLEERSEALERSNRDLGVAVATAKRAADTLLEQHDTLARTDRMAAVGEMAGGLAHEIRNPLAGIKMSLENLRSEVPDPAIRERIDLPIAELDRLARLLNRYLSPLRHEPEPVTSVAMRALIDDLCGLLRYRLPANIELVADVAGDFTWNLPKDRIRQSLLNLVLNAIQAIGDAPGTITIRALRVGDRLDLCVEDDGPGFPESFLEGPVQRFASRSEKGTGLGLAMVVRVAEDLGGRLVLERCGSRGARVRLELPARAG